MQGTKNSNESVISQEQFQQLMSFLTQEIQRAQQQGMNEIREVMTQTITDDLPSIKEKLKEVKSSLEQLRSGKITQDEIKEAIDEIFSMFSGKETQESIVKNINKELVDKFKNLPPVRKALIGFGLVSAAVGIMVGAAIAIPVILVALPFALLYIGLKRAMPSKAEFKKTWQGISHDFKNALDKVPTVQEKDSNIKKLFCDLNVTQDYKDFITEYIVKNDGSKDQLKVDDNKIEAFKKAVLIEKPNIDNKKISSEIDRLAEKGKSTSDGDYGEFKAQIEKIITTIDQDVLESQEMKETFKAKLAEVKQPEELKKAIKEVEKETKKIDKAVGEKNGLFTSLFSKNSSHTENVEEGRNKSSSNQGRGT